MIGYYVLVDDNSRIVATSKDCHLSKNEFVFDFPENFDFDNQMDYKIINGECIYDPQIIEPVVEEPTQLDRIEAQITYTAMMTDTILEV